MNKYKKALVVACVFLTVGLAGSIITGIRMIPKITSEIYRIQREVVNAEPIEKEKYASEEVVENLDISAIENGNLDVEIKKSDDSYTRIKVYEYLEDIQVETTYNADTKTLVVDGYRQKMDFLNETSIKKFFEKGYETLIYSLADSHHDSSQIVIEVPVGVNITFKGEYNTNLKIKDTVVLKDSLDYVTKYGYVNLPHYNTLKDINIRSNSHVNMDVREFINAEKVSIKGQDIDIDSNGYTEDYEKIEKLPSVVSISANYIDITSFIPLGTDVDLAGNNIEYNSNFNDYSLNLKLMGLRNGSAYYDDEDPNGTLLDRRDLGSNYEGIIGENSNKEYKLTISDYDYLNINNISLRELENRVR